jgi:hypothetical protein
MGHSMPKSELARKSVLLSIDREHRVLSISLNRDVGVGLSRAGKGSGSGTGFGEGGAGWRKSADPYLSFSGLRIVNRRITSSKLNQFPNESYVFNEKISP